MCPTQREQHVKEQICNNYLLNKFYKGSESKAISIGHAPLRFPWYLPRWHLSQAPAGKPAAYVQLECQLLKAEIESSLGVPSP